MLMSNLIFQLSTGNETLPVSDAVIIVTDLNEDFVAQLVTDLSGRAAISVDTPSLSQTELSMIGVEPAYATYHAAIQATGFIPVEIRGIQVYDGINSIEAYEMNPLIKDMEQEEEKIDIPAPAIQDYDAKLNGDSIPNSQMNSRILNTVYIPRTITVHLGSPSNSSAENVTVSFPSYIKNVCSSEIYPTWPENAIRANIYCQISFALNRIFTEWYPSRGYYFNITNHTGYDQYYVKGRNIFENISQFVDEIFNEYVRKKGALNPLFTEYCNGTTVTCSGLSQWGTVTLANKGYTPLRILQYYYGTGIELTATDDIEDILSSYPGSALQLGIVDASVKIIKQELNQIGKNYPAIPSISTINTTFDAETKAAVKAFQKIFDLTQDGIVGKATWNKLSYIYVAVLRLSELNGGMVTPSIPEESPTLIIGYGSTGDVVKLAQYFLVIISQYTDLLPLSDITGYFGNQTTACVKDFQSSHGLDPDGIIGPVTWDALYNTYLGIARTLGIDVTYPGEVLKVGSSGDQVWLVQSYLQKISQYMSIPYLVVDGIYGNATKKSVVAFQELLGLTPDGIVDPDTWNMIVATRMLF